MRRREAIGGLGGALAYFTERLPYLPEAEKARAYKALQYLGKYRLSKPPEVAPEFDNEETARAAFADLHAFVVAAWNLVEPGTPFIDNWHIRKLCRVLMDVSAGKIKRLLINVPPGSMKSLLVEVFWPAWEWAHDPRKRFLTVSHSDALTIRDNVRLREIITSPWYEKWFWNATLAKAMRVGQVRLKGDQNEKVRFDNTAQGWRIATGIGGRGVGEHPDYKVVDDPITPEQARSEADRKRVWNYLKQTLSTRGTGRGAAIIVIMQRLHLLDPSGHLLRQGDYEHVMWPMEFEVDRADPRDEREQEGDLLWPALFTAEKVAQLKLDLDPYGVAGQLQQRPAPEGGGLFKREWFEGREGERYVDAVPADAERCRGWDTGGSDRPDSDYTVGVKLARDSNGVYYIEDVVRGQFAPSEVELIIMQTVATDGHACRQREEKEPGSAGAQVVAARARILAGYDYKGVPVTTKKAIRAGPFRAQVEAGNVRIKRAPWNEAYLAEMEMVFVGEHDDQADASSAAFNELATGSVIQTRTVAWG